MSPSDHREHRQFTLPVPLQLEHLGPPPPPAIGFCSSTCFTSTAPASTPSPVASCDATTIGPIALPLRLFDLLPLVREIGGGDENSSRAFASNLDTRGVTAAVERSRIRWTVFFCLVESVTAVECGLRVADLRPAHDAEPDTWGPTGRRMDRPGPLKQGVVTGDVPWKASYFLTRRIPTTGKAAGDVSVPGTGRVAKTAMESSTLQTSGMLSKEQLIHLFNRFAFLTSQQDVKNRIADAVKDKQEAVAVTTAIQEEILLEMGIDPRFGITCLGKVGVVYESDRDLMIQFYAFVAKEEMACDEAELEPDEFEEKMLAQKELQKQQLEMLKCMRKLHQDDQSTILEALHKQMAEANFDYSAPVLTPEQMEEAVRTRSTVHEYNSTGKPTKPQGTRQKKKNTRGVEDEDGLRGAGADQIFRPWLKRVQTFRYLHSLWGLLRVGVLLSCLPLWRIFKILYDVVIHPRLPDPFSLHHHHSQLELLAFLITMEEEAHKELQLLPMPSSTAHLISTTSDLSSLKLHRSGQPPPSLNLQLSISLQPVAVPPPSNCLLAGAIHGFEGIRSEFNSIEALKREAAEQIRLAAVEKAYAERVRELTRREMEMAETEFAQAKHMWGRAQQEVESARRLKEKATRRIDSTCMEITCQACRQSFRA
ncbi:hypothetical protein H6P81_012094 [Aristolochia fimbriata]|uniref:Uncharacterized protein n=1 Tax=Aristolochia fimbriata TaxID=158543 RepID=A0AAV7EDY4_ARIFI|nr:hypothetical protein H6P81_012094 [Aristolochia fimbriata]